MTLSIHLKIVTQGKEIAMKVILLGKLYKLLISIHSRQGLEVDGNK